MRGRGVIGRRNLLCKAEGIDTPDCSFSVFISGLIHTCVAKTQSAAYYTGVWMHAFVDGHLHSSSSSDDSVSNCSSFYSSHHI